MAEYDRSPPLRGEPSPSSDVGPDHECDFVGPTWSQRTCPKINPNGRHEPLLGGCLHFCIFPSASRMAFPSVSSREGKPGRLDLGMKRETEPRRPGANIKMKTVPRPFRYDWVRGRGARLLPLTRTALMQPQEKQTDVHRVRTAGRCRCGGGTSTNLLRNVAVPVSP